MPGDSGPGDSGHSHLDEGFRVAITGCEIAGDFLRLRYSLSPVPAVLADGHARHEGTGAGLAIDGWLQTYRQCRSSYRLSSDGLRVLGTICFGPAWWPPTLGTLRVLFAPLAHTPGLSALLCEVQVTADATGTRATLVRDGPGRPAASAR